MTEPSRRVVLTSTLAGVAAVGLAASKVADAAPTALAPTHDPVLHAVRRLTFGPTPKLLAHVRKVGVTAWLDEQLASSTDVGATVNGVGYPSLPLPTVLAQDVSAYAGRNAVQDLQRATIAKASYGDNQVYELMVEFWSNHFSIHAYGEQVGAYKVADDRDVIRPHALGRFSELLKASMQSPAMLRYLSNADSRGYHPNENYARELLELHTVGIHGGYDQHDVISAAWVLTGLTVDLNTGLFHYEPSWHATGPVRVMGWSSPNAKPKDGLKVALSLGDYLAHHPATARRLATKLVRRLVSDKPPASLVASAARVYLANDTAIVPVLKHIVASREFRGSAGRKSQRPFEWFTAAVRALDVQPQADSAFNGGAVYWLEQMGQAPFEWVQPDGYPDVASAWASTANILSRWNTAQALVHGRIAGLKPVDAGALVGTPVPTTAGALVDRLAVKLLGATPRTALRQSVVHGVNLSSTSPLSSDRALSVALPMAALLLSSPEAQVR